MDVGEGKPRFFDLRQGSASDLSSSVPIADQAKQFCNFMQRNVTATFDLGDKQAKDMQDALKTQSEFFQDQIRALTDQAKNLGEPAMKTVSGMFGQKNRNGQNVGVEAAWLVFRRLSGNAGSRNGREAMANAALT